MRFRGAKSLTRQWTT